MHLLNYLIPLFHGKSNISVYYIISLWCDTISVQLILIKLIWKSLPVQRLFAAPFCCMCMNIGLPYRHYLYYLFLFYGYFCPKIFSEGFVFGCVWFLFFMFSCTLSLEWLKGCQPNFHTRWRCWTARTPLKMVVVSLTIWRLSWIMSIFEFLCIFSFMHNAWRYHPGFSPLFFPLLPFSF